MKLNPSKKENELFSIKVDEVTKSKMKKNRKC